MRQRLACWGIMAVLAAGCATPDASQPPVQDQTDVWFMQHMVPHLLQTAAIVDLARDRITRPELARLADSVDQQGQAHLAQLQAWLASRGLAAYDAQQDPNRRKETDLERLAQVRGAGFDLAFVKVMTARHSAGSKLAAAEARAGSVPELRQLAQQLLADQQDQIGNLRTGSPLGAGSRLRPSHLELTHGGGLLAPRTVKRWNATAWASE